MAVADGFSYTFWAQGLGGGRGERWLFEGLDLELGPGDVLVVTGPNGTGKTTLLRFSPVCCQRARAGLVGAPNRRISRSACIISAIKIP